MTTTTVQIEDRYRQREGLLHLTGIQALVRVPLDLHRADRARGRRTAVFISGYPGSPLGGYDLELGRRSKLLEEHDVVFQPAVNEELGASAVAGSQLSNTRPELRYDGVSAIWYGKAPGLDRAVDALRHGNMAGAHAHGGVLALVGDDPAAKSSTMPNASELTLAALGMPTLYPADSQDALDLGLHGIALSRACGLWVGMKIVTDVADGSGTVEVHPERVVPVLPDVEIDGRPFHHIVQGMLLQPTSGQLERSLVHERPLIAQRYAAVNRLDRIVRQGPDDRIGIVCSGKTYLDVCQALSSLGLDEQECTRAGVRLLKLAMINPVEPGIITDFAAGLHEIVVVEEKRSFLEAAIKHVLYGRPGAPAVHGKTAPDGTTLVPANGELDPDVLAPALARRLLAHGDVPSVEAWAQAPARQGPRTPTPLPLLARTPYYCSGCPHSSSLPAPDGTFIGTGTGCSSLAVLMAPETVGDVGVLMQMGGEGSQWIGMAPFLDLPHMVQNIGDGTFHHSGSLALRAAAASGVRITYKILYNSTVAMTGGQAAQGGMTVPALATMLGAEGVGRIIVTTDLPDKYDGVRLPGGTEVWHRDRMIEAQEVLAQEPGVTVVVHDQECATEKRRLRKRGQRQDPPMRVLINERVCEGCGDCGRKSNCLSVVPIDTEFGRKTQIDQASCNKDYSCLAGDCPSFITILPGKTSVRRATAPELPASVLPDPPSMVDIDDFSLRIVGVGGTGVVTVAQILATAAQLAGRHVRGMDQTGMAQKGGAVVSDLKLSSSPVLQAARVAQGECDLFLGCDLLVAADPKTLAATDPQRTFAVVSTAEVPTGAMIVDPDVSFPPFEDVEERIRSATRGKDAVFLNAQALTQALLGDDQTANVLLVGAAYQRGLLPLPAAVIEQAIEVNGAAIAVNLQAFRRGRQAVADPQGLQAALEAVTPAAPARQVGPDGRRLAALVQAHPESELARIVAVRVPDLIAYQDTRWARRYAELVERVRAVESQRLPGSAALAEAVAVGLHKFMSYKDEYEVARLQVDPALRASITAQFGDGATFSYRLHPPLLRALGRTEKMSFDSRFLSPVLRGLYALRRVRGTALDPFGYAEVRRTERALLDEYRELVHRLLDLLVPGNHEVGVQLAALPDMVRGYEHIKMDNVRLYRERRADLLRQLDRAPCYPPHDLVPAGS